VYVDVDLDVYSGVWVWGDADQLSALGQSVTALLYCSLTTIFSTFDHRTLRASSLVRSTIFLCAELCYLFPRTENRFPALTPTKSPIYTLAIISHKTDVQPMFLFIILSWFISLAFLTFYELQSFISSQLRSSHKRRSVTPLI
jgi:hypothetical protein